MDVTIEKPMYKLILHTRILVWNGWNTGALGGVIGLEQVLERRTKKFQTGF
jgi:hypothetical protein